MLIASTKESKPRNISWALTQDDGFNGVDFTTKGDFAGSVRYYQAALGKAPEDGVTKILLNDALGTLASTWANKGDQARWAGKFSEAVSIYSQALQVDAGAPRVHSGLGLIYFA